MVRGRVILLREFRQGTTYGDSGCTKDHNEEQTEGYAADKLARFGCPPHVRVKLPEVRPHLVTVVGDVHQEH